MSHAESQATSRLRDFNASPRMVMLGDLGLVQACSLPITVIVKML
jgi:hypothetical protein